jgi:hypothetical protein
MPGPLPNYAGTPSTVIRLTAPIDVSSCGSLFDTAWTFSTLPRGSPISPARHRSRPSTLEVTTEALQSEEAVLTSGGSCSADA